MTSQATTAPLVSVVIRCFNEQKHIGKALDGIREQTHRNVELIVVDSGSTDATVEIACRHPVKLLRIEPESFSFGRSLNLGCSAATGEYIVIVSAHVYPLYRDWLEKMIAPFADPKVALTYGMQRAAETSYYSERRLMVRWFPPASNLSQRQPFCNNANSAIRRELWGSLPYDEELTGAEDVQWATRALAMGYHLAYEAEAPVIHVHNEAPRAIYNRYRREALAIKSFSPRERLKLWDIGPLLVGNVLSDYYHAARDGVLRRNLLSIPTFRLMQFWGAYRGFSHNDAVTSALKRRFYYPSGRGRVEMPARESEQDERIDYSRLSSK